MANSRDIEALREWMQKQPHFPEKVEDILLERFLITCKNSLEKTKNVLDLFFRLRTEAPEFFTNRDPKQESIKNMFKLIDTIPLTKRTKEGYQIYLHRLNDPDPDKFDFVTYAKAFFIITDTRFKLETDLPAGDIPVFDMSGFTFKHLTKLMSAISSYKKYMQLTQDTHPVKLKAVHVINTNAIVSRLMTFVKPLLNPEVRDMLHFHSTMDTFIEKVPLDILPTEYGGTGGSMEEIREMTYKKIEEGRDWLMSDPWLSNENKRLDKKNSSALITGSFRALSLD